MTAGDIPAEPRRYRVSVIATVKNEASTVEPFLDALLAQTRQPDEVVLVDGGSTDRTMELLEAYRQRDARIRIHQASTASISRGRNIAIEHAAGPLIAVTDAGTRASRDWLENLIRPLELDPTVALSAGFFVAGGRTWFERTLSTLITTQLAEVDPSSFLPSSRSVAFRKEWWARVGGYPEWLRHGEDLVFDLDLRRAGARFAFAADALVTWYSRATLPQYFRQYFNYGRAEGRAGLFSGRNASRYAAYMAGTALLSRSRRRPRLLLLLGSGVGIHFSRFYRRLWRRPPARTASGLVAAHVIAPVVIVVGDVAKMIGFPVGVALRLGATSEGAATPDAPPVSTRCPACDGPLRPWKQVGAGEPSDSRSFTLLRCDACGTAVTEGAPPPQDLYERGMYVPAKRLTSLIDRLQRTVMRQPARMLRRAGLPSGRRVLDVGAGRGRLVAALQEAGYDASGIEPSRLSASIAIADGLPITRTTIEQHTDEGLEAAALWHVLEHLEDPADSLRRVHSWLQPGGLLLVGVPNLDSWQARVGAAEWLHFDAPRHRAHFTSAGALKLLERSGFDVISVEHLVWQQNPLGMWLAMLSRCGLKKNFALHVVKKTVDATPLDQVLLAAGVALVPLAVAAELLAAACRRGGTIAVLAKAVDLTASQRSSRSRAL